MAFNCTSCGACCSRIRSVAELFKGVKGLKFPHFIDEKGRCEMLDENNRCKVYENRPTICNIDKMRAYSGIDEVEFYKMNKEACNRMITEDNLDKKYLIKD